MKVLVTGSNGLVGQLLVEKLEKAGHATIRLVRGIHDADHTIVLWNPTSSTIVNPQRLENLDAVIHLAGENIAQGRWTPGKKLRIRNSRVQGTGLLANTLAGLDHKPKTFLCASAIGFYGDQGTQVCTEDSEGGETFLAGVCRDWEAATQPAAEAGIRTIQLRFGMILSSRGGALCEMLTPFRWGVGGPMGSGRQYWSWISLNDAVNAILYLLDSELSGPVNLTSPNPVTNKSFAAALGKALKRPAVLSMPAFAARAVLGEMADELILDSARVIPEKLLQAGFSFQDPDLLPLLTRLVKEAP